MSGDPVLDDLAAGARLRASLAAADRLLGLLADVAARPTFRYTRVAAESVGTIGGRLDLSRFSRQLGRITVPRRYPIPRRSADPTFDTIGLRSERSCITARRMRPTMRLLATGAAKFTHSGWALSSRPVSCSPLPRTLR